MSQRTLAETEDTVEDATEHGENTPLVATPSAAPYHATSYALSLAVLILLQSMNISMLTTTQSAIAKDLRAYDKTSWFTSTYLITMSALGPLNGKLSGIFSPPACIFVSSMILAVGGVFSGLASNFELFLVGRSISGCGAAGIFTVAVILVLDLTKQARRGLAIGLLNAGYTAGVAFGATTAGTLLPLTGWRVLFYGQAPIALLAGTVLFLSLPKWNETENDLSVARLDYLGALTLTASIVLLLLGLSSPKSIQIWPIVASLIVLVMFVVWEMYGAYDPIIPVRLLRSRGLLFTCLGTVGYMMTRWTVLFYAPTYAIAVREWSPGTAGSILIPTNAGFALGGLLVGWLHIKRSGSFYYASLVAYTLFPLTMAALALLSAQQSSVILYLVIIFINGAISGAALNYTLAHVLHLTPKDTHYVATSLITTFRGLAGSFGAAIGGGFFTRQLNATLHAEFRHKGIRNEPLVRELLGSPALVRNLKGIAEAAAVDGYEAALRTLFFAGAGLAATMILVQAATGRQ
ncbi:MFS general substrate transporter [Piedraia hortae CBS 480.64]|uniref:MFS general substrate transporter n=1 Tax=Piedraia hortae CBS 480.64 TaxID=1314780 RepID=A0A6A7BS51_9PEZI|nr:MFS general substrate transporter [Piedraia hortae CBS 480.64]